MLSFQYITVFKVFYEVCYVRHYKHFKYIAFTDVDEVHLTNATYTNLGEHLMAVEKVNNAKGIICKNFIFERQDFVTNIEVDRHA